MKRITLYNKLKVAGPQHHPGGQELMLLSGNLLLVAKREPDNQYDRNAIALYLPGGETKCGYVPATHSQGIAALIDNSIGDLLFYVGPPEGKTRILGIMLCVADETDCHLGLGEK